MSPSDDADRRIADLEQKLAEIQHDETTPLQFEANLRRQRLGAALATAAVMATTASGFIASLADGFERSVQQLADDLNGSHDR